ncbi:MAG: hypothetical protein EON94_03405 [Caulobacteraceae bacterium]|nr:MAG: hypothetical protein EON94_03405 [Caulobacteraceae bacterium]
MLFDLTGRICEHKDRATPPRALVGTDVTFGAGGASINPADGRTPNCALGRSWASNDGWV